MRKMGRQLLAAGLIAVASIAQANERTVLIVGDSLSAGYGIALEDGWATLLEQRLQTTYPGWKVQNASISGETSDGGMRRLPALLEQYQPGVVVIELGGNDGLRGQKPARFQANLEAMVAASQQANAEVVMIRIRLPANYGARYDAGFQSAYVAAAGDKVPLTQFMPLEQRADPELLQDDGIHPTAAAQPMMEANVWPAIERAILKAADVDRE